MGWLTSGRLPILLCMAVLGVVLLLFGSVLIYNAGVAVGEEKTTCHVKARFCSRMVCPGDFISTMDKYRGLIVYLVVEQPMSGFSRSPETAEQMLQDRGWISTQRGDPLYCFMAGTFAEQYSSEAEAAVQTN